MSSDLRTQFLNYMSVQRFSPHTKRSYLTGVKLLAKHYMQSPDTLTNEQIQDYLRYLLEDRKLSWGTCNDYLSCIGISNSKRRLKTAIKIYGYRLTGDIIYWCIVRTTMV